MYTNLIGGHWAVLRKHISKCQCSDDQLNDIHLEEMWRHQNKENLWKGLRKALKFIMLVDLNPFNNDDDNDKNKNPYAIAV